ncbi:class I SAM-dependent methyltransferase [Candidatus Woesearchaeota archaeon]|nr:class I SAM-dependent methyltransferase [Candidatus Woesearchaeota archaeon]
MDMYDKYAYFVDLTYSIKNYEKEVDFICDVLKKHNKNTKLIYDVACGSGSHSILLKKKGFDVIGVDLHDGMLKIARKKGLKAYKQDMRNLCMKKNADCIITMFNSISHLNGYTDLKKMVLSYLDNLNVGGLIIFDCVHTIDNWHKEFFGIRKYDVGKYFISKADMSYLLSSNKARVQQVLTVFKKKTTQRNIIEFEYDNFIFDVDKIKGLLKNLGLKFKIYYDFSISRKKPKNKPWYIFVIQKT